jgi:hypothetical protein
MQSRQVICTKVLIVAVAATSSAVSIAADADSLEELNRQIEVLSQKVLELDRKQQAAEREQTEAAKNVVTAGASKGSFKLPGSSTSVTLGGYVKLDAVFTSSKRRRCEHCRPVPAAERNSRRAGRGRQRAQSGEVRRARIAGVRQDEHTHVVG